MSETMHAPESYPDMIMFTSMFQRQELGRSESAKLMSGSIEKGDLRGKIQTWLLVFLWFMIGEDFGMTIKNDHLTSLQTVSGTNLFHDDRYMYRWVVHRVQVSQLSSNRCIYDTKVKRWSWSTFQKRA